MSRSTDFLNSLSDMTFEAIERSAKEYDLSDEQVQEVLNSVLERGHEQLLTALKSNAPDMLAKLNEDNAGFRARCYERWREPMDLLWMLWVITQEVTEAHAHEGPREVDPLVFDTLAHLNPKALLITSEILCLLEGGFADGALARWRSLHETVVTAMFIRKHGRTVARDFRLSVWFDNHKAATALNLVADRAGIPAFSDEELSEIVAARDAAEAEVGRRLRFDWDWASTAFGGRERLQFVDIERDVGMDHWRPRYKWSSQRVHSSFRSPMDLLGMSEAEDFRFQIGPSNSGFVDPMHMTAISLVQMATTFLMVGEINVDRLVYVQILKALSDEIGEAAFRVQEETLQAHHSAQG